MASGKRPAQTMRPGSSARAREAAAPPPAKRTGRTGSETARARDEHQVRGTVKDDVGATLYWARRPFGYAGEDLDRGQVIGLIGALNDEKLVRLGYVLSVLPGDRPHRCRFCPRQFIDLETLNAHGAKRHRDRDEELDLPAGRVVDGARGPKHSGVTVDETAGRVQELEAEERLMNEIAPLNLDKTKANRDGRGARG